MIAETRLTKTANLIDSEGVEHNAGRANLSERGVRFLRGLSRWLTIRRLTAHAAIAATLIWAMFAYNLSGPGLLDRLGDLKGTDFLQFYIVGSFAQAHRIAEMYGVHQFADATERAIPGIQGWHYLPVYPPQIALIFRPLAAVPYLGAFAIWSAINLLLYAVCLAVMAHLYPELAAERSALILAALAFPPFFNAIGHGQVSILMLACVVAAFYAFVREHRFLAGLALGCLAFKPPIYLAFLLACLAVVEIRVVAGMAAAGVAQLLVDVLFAGLASIRAYVEFAAKLPRVDTMVLAVKPYQMHSLRSFWMLLLGAGRLEVFLWVMSSVVVLMILGTYWSRERAADMRFAAMIAGAVLIDPHLYIYDAIVLAPALVVAVERARMVDALPSADAIRCGVYALFVCLFLGPLSRITHVQLSVLVMAALFLAMTHTDWTPKSIRRLTPAGRPRSSRI